ncbi:MAG: ABC transporter permease, partial [Fusobacterium sp.]
MKALIVNIKVYYKMIFRNMLIFISSYLLPIVFYLMFSVVFTSISDENKKTIIASMCIFAILMSSYIGLPGNTVRYSNGEIKRAYIAGGIKLWHVFVCLGINNIINCSLVSLFIILTAPVFFGAVAPSGIFYFVSILLLSILISTLIGLLIGMVSRTENASVIISQMLFLPSLFISGVMVDVSILPDMMKHLSKVLPATNMCVLFSEMNQSSMIYMVLLSIVILLM